MIRFPCAGCDKVMNVADEHAGKKAKCPACGEVVVIPRKSILPEPTKGPPAKTAPSKPPAVVSRKPQPADEENGEEDRKPAAQVSRKPMPVPAKLKAKAPPPDEDDEDIPELEAVDDEDDVEEAEEVDEDEDEDRPRKKSKKKPKKRRPVRKGEYVSCPNCGAGGAFRVFYSFWFGFTPALVCQVQCPRCGTQYNGNTGGSNTGTLIIIQVVITVVVVGFIVAANVLAMLAGG
jgi:uncharacterized protein (DUF983 family)